MKVLVLAGFAALTAAQSNFSVGAPVQTTSGTVIGHPSPLDPTVSEYLGIPWGVPPLGPLRFMPPKRFPKSDKPLEAKKFGPDCPQMRASSNRTGLTDIQKGVLSNLGGTNPLGEECLTLNVWTKPQLGEKKKAVLVWIYGGGFSTGSTASPSYNGVRFAGKEDVVLVSINYRLMFFGFPANPSLFNDVNVGLLDQRAALEWVRDNIAAFGGDPSRITIFGESAGGRSVDMYSYTWASDPDPIVAGFIAESGAAPQWSGWKPRPSAWFEVSKRVGCGGQEKGKDTIPCVQGKSMEELLKAMGKQANGGRDISRAFTPVVDNKTYFGDYDRRRKEGLFIKKPMMTGNNDNEAGLQNFVATLQGNPYSPEQIKKTNLAYNCQARYACDARKANNVPIWRYRWMAQFPNQRLGKNSGAWHGSEIPSVFGLVDNIKGGQATDEQKALSMYMLKAWAEFAKDPNEGLYRVGLPQWDANETSLWLLGEERANYGVSFAKGDQFDGECSTLKDTMPGME